MAQSTELLPDLHSQTRRTLREFAERVGCELAGQHGTWLAFTIRIRKRPLCAGRPARQMSFTRA